MPPQESRKDPDDGLRWQVFWGLERISVLFHLLFQKVADSHLSPLHIRILLTLAFLRKPMPVLSLGKLINLPASTTSRIVWELKKQELIEYQPEDRDRRIKRIVLTQKGKTLSEKYAIQIMKVFERIVPAGEDQKTWLEDLHRLELLLIRSAVRNGFIQETKACFTCQFFTSRGSTFYCRFLQMELNRDQLKIFCPDHSDI